MDLTAAIRHKIDRLRTSKTNRFNSLSSAIEREVALLTRQSAELFTKLEDALEEDVLGSSEDLGEMKRLKEEEDIKKDGAGVEQEDGDDKDASDESLPIKDKHSETGQEGYDSDEERDTYYDHGVDGKQPPAPYSAVHRQRSHTPSTSAAKQDDTVSNTVGPPIATVDVVRSHKQAESLVSYLRSRSQETQNLLAEKNLALAQLRQKHDIAMKRLDKLQSDLEKISQKWEAEERARVQTESKSALGKRKREEDDVEGHARRWKTWGLKGVEWGVLFGIGVVSAVGMNKFQY